VRWRTLPASAPGKVGPRANLYGVTKGFLDSLSDRVLVADGAMGTMLHAADPSVDDYQGHEGCSEILSVTLPDVVRGIHDAYFAAGADCVETNTFGANLSALAEYGLADRIFELSRAGARLAREVADGFGDRFVLGSIGPGTKLPTLGHLPYTTLRDAYQLNAAGLLGWGDRIGSLEAGKLADIIAVDGDPLKDVKELQKVKFVMKGGEVVKNDYSK